MNFPQAVLQEGELSARMELSGGNRTDEGVQLKFPQGDFHEGGDISYRVSQIYRHFLKKRNRNNATYEGFPPPQYITLYAKFLLLTKFETRWPSNQNMRLL